MKLKIKLPVNSVNTNHGNILINHNKQNKMQIKTLSFAITAMTTSVTICAQTLTNDSIEKNIYLKEFILNSKKTTDYAGMTTAIKSKDIDNERNTALKDISLYVPNLYIPNYGSKTTSTIYSRGLSTRMNEPSIGLYIDGIPIMNKSMYDIETFGLSKMNVALGPQGTLYGKNAAGGIIDIETVDESMFDGKIHLGLTAGHGNHNENRERLTISGGNQKFGIQLSGHYDNQDGWAENLYDKSKNHSESEGGRINMFWNLPQQWKIKLHAAYDHSNERAYPYENTETGNIDYNDMGYYRRDYVMSGINIAKKIGKSQISSITGYQYLDDNMLMDIDYTSNDFFSLRQKQRQHSVTEELSLRTHLTKYNQVTGLFGSWSRNDLNAPMQIGTDGVNMIQTIFDNLKAANPRMPDININNKTIDICGDFVKTDHSIALYHQSSYSPIRKLTITVGLRAEYDRAAVDYNSQSELNTTVNVKIPGIGTMSIPKDSTYSVYGNAHKEYWEFLPKLSVKYVFNDKYNIYAAAAKGFKAGGYNQSMASNIIQSQMSNSTLIGNASDLMYYKPEYVWSFELGAHTQPLSDILFIDAAIFYNDDRNQQMSTTTDNGARIIANADKTSSCGIEIMAKYTPIENLTFAASYGYTHAEFKKYSVDNVSYKGKTVPFVPQNTFCIGAEYTIPVNVKYIDGINIRAEYKGLGKTYWDDANEYSEDFFGQLSGSVALQKDKWEIRGWVKNVSFDGQHDIFYCESMGKRFVEKTAPISYGVTIKKNL